MRVFAPVATAMFAAGCGIQSPCPPAELPPLAELPAYAVVTSDYTSTAIALLSADGDLMNEAWVDSGSADAGIVAALSGDVSLPTTPLAAGELTLIDRFGVDVITRLDLRSGAVVAQVDAQLAADGGGAGFRSNPQDAVVDEDGSILVSRFEPNLDPAAPLLDRGNDIVRLDDDGPVTRISFDDLDVVVGGTRIYARPGRIARLADALVVGLGRLSIDFTVAGPGAIAVIAGDPATPVAVALPGLENCPELRATPDGSAVIVLCAGQTFGDASARRPRAGIARVAMGPSGPELVEVWRAADHPDAPVPTGAPIPLGDGRVAAPALGDGSAGDRVVVVDLGTGEARAIHTAEREFVIGAGAYDTETDLLLVPAAGRGVLRFSVAGSTPIALDAVPTSPCRGLPARQVGALRP